MPAKGTGKGMAALTCATCTGTFFRFPSQAGKFCSAACRRSIPTGTVRADGVVEIPLYGHHARLRGILLIDEADQAWVTQWRWSFVSGYAQRKDGRTLIRLHRALMGCTPDDGVEVDHINRNRLDNRRANLRIVSHHGNQQNLPSQRGSTSQYRGVSWFPRTRKWAAAVTVNGKHHHLGYFLNEADAAEAARTARARLMPHAVD